MVFPPGRWALVLAACLLAAAPAPTTSQGEAAVPAEPLPEDVQLLFDLELRGPPGGASNLLPWAPANEATVAEVLCRGYLPAADPADVTVEVINTFTFLAPAPAEQTAAGSSARRLLRVVSLQQQAEQPRQEQGGLRGQKKTASARPRAAQAPTPAEQRQQRGEGAGAPAPAAALEQQREAAAAPAQAPAEQPERQREPEAAPAPAVVAPPERWRRAPAAKAPAPAEQPQRRQGAAAAPTPAPAPATAAEEADEWRSTAAGPAPALAPGPAAEEARQRESKGGRQRPQRQERQQQQGGKEGDAPPRKEQAEAQQMVTGVGVELKITLPSTLSRAAAELDAVEGAVTVGKLAQDLTAAGLVVDSAAMVAAYLEEPQPRVESSNPDASAAAWQAGAPAAAPLAAV